MIDPSVFPLSMSVSAAWFESGRVTTWTQGKGINPSTQFQAASLSKFVFSLLCTIMAQKGLYDLDRTVIHDITVRELLSHAGGVNVAGFSGYGRNDQLPDLKEIISGSPPANNKPLHLSSENRGQFMYSGLGYCLVQQDLEQHTGETLHDLASRLIFAPLQMMHSSFSIDPENHYAPGRDVNGIKVPGCYHHYPEQAAAGLWTCPADLLLITQSLFNSLHENQVSFLNFESVRDFLQPQISMHDQADYCLGLIKMKKAASYGHDGGNRGYASQLSFNTLTQQARCLLISSEAGFDVMDRYFSNYL